MLDFNSTEHRSAHLQGLIDSALQQAQTLQVPRNYLGGSRLGVACERALQFEYTQAPVDADKAFSGRILRIFERGHLMEDCMASWIRAAGFDLRTRGQDGQQFGFSVLQGRLAGHVDGIIVAGPEGYSYPALWECKCLGAKSWSDLHKKGLAISKPVYAAQVAVYQAYLQLHEHPAVFTALNADTMEVYTELLPFDAQLAQQMSDRGLRVITATEAGELLPRRFNDPSHFECRFCSYQMRCWQGELQ